MGRDFNIEDITSMEVKVSKDGISKMKKNPDHLSVNSNVVVSTSVTNMPFVIKCNEQK